MSLASQAAAMAAFKAINKTEDQNGNSKIDKTFKIPKSHPSEPMPYIPRGNTHKRTLSTKSLPRLKTTVSNTSSPKRSAGQNSSDIEKTPRSSSTLKEHSIYDLSQFSLKSPGSTSQTPTDIASVQNSVEYFTLPRQALMNSPVNAHTIVNRNSSVKKSNSTLSNLTLNNARAFETIDNLKQSINAKSVAKDASSKRISQDYAPNEMINKIKQSINEKTKAASATNHSKNRDRINEIRESIDLKRINTPLKSEYLAESPLITDSGYASSNDNVPYLRHKNNSSSTVGSSILYSDSTRSDYPAIVVDDIDGDYNNQSNNELDNDFLDGRNIKQPNLSHESFQKPITPILSHSSTASPVSPIMIPMSLGANAREAALGSSESLQFGSSSRSKFQSFDSNIALAESLKLKPKRKPPPNLEDEVNQSEYTDVESKAQSKLASESEVYSIRSLINYDSSSEKDLKTSEKEIFESSNDSNSKLPQFPGLEKKHNHKSREPKRSIFKKKNKIPYIDLLLIENDSFVDPGTPSSSRPTTPMYQNLAHQMKTTMRKAHKKKKQFNEDKPWKNHTDLSFVTEGERKRYEGLWASNKGQYIKNVATKLQGINYDVNDEIEIREKEIEQDPSLKAAKISSMSTHDFSSVDEFKQFHNLNSADTDNLILGLIVKRIWSRSKLPNETLELIWNLVDFRKDGTLNKHEFLVGMWLVDQCLYGRKLPKKVDDSVWSSLESIGLNVIIKKRNRK